MDFKNLDRVLHRLFEFPDDPDGLIAKQFLDFELALQSATKIERDRAKEAWEQYRKYYYSAKAAVENAMECALCCVYHETISYKQSVDKYLEIQIFNFEDLQSQLRKLISNQSSGMGIKWWKIYETQRIFLERTLTEKFDDPSGKTAEILRTGFADIFNHGVILAHINFLEIVGNFEREAIGHREDEVTEMIVRLKDIEKENQEIFKGKSLKEIPKDRGHVIAIAKLVADEYTNDANSFLIWTRYVEDESKRIREECGERNKLTVKCCRDFVDRALEADIPVFDEMISETKKTVMAALESTDKLTNCLLEQLTAMNASGIINTPSEVTLNIIKSNQKEFKEEQKHALRRLEEYRDEDRSKVREQNQRRLKGYNDLSLLATESITLDGDKLTIPADIDISSYDLESIGKGGQGTVYKTIINGQQVAVKQFHDQNGFKEIAQHHVANSSYHPNILRFIARGFRGSEHFLIVEYCPSSLAEEFRMRRTTCRNLDKKDVKKWIVQMVSGMASVHGLIEHTRRELYHGDLKPENILLDDRRNIKIADFGVSLRTNLPALIAENKCMKGTLRYMAPELVRGEVDVSVIKNADVWSWAIVVWEMVANRRPYDLLEDAQLYGHIGKNCHHPPLPSGTIESLENLLRRCWSAKQYYRPNFVKIENELPSILEELDALTEEEWQQVSAAWREAQ